MVFKMIKKILKSLTISLILTLMMSTLALADGQEKKIDKNIDGTNVSLIFHKEEIKIGDNGFTVVLKDDKNQPISNAKVEATVEMDKSDKSMDMNMEGDKPTKLDLTEGSKNGEYSGKADFTDKGKWLVKTTFFVNGQQENTDFEINVESAGPNWFIIGGFLGVIVLIIAVAAVKKKKSVQA